MTTLMSDVTVPSEPVDIAAGDSDRTLSSEHPEPAPPITNRFLFVNVSGMRAKQLRRGAQPRLSEEQLAALGPTRSECIAKEEVIRGMVPYALPDFRAGFAARV